MPQKNQNFPCQLYLCTSEGWEGFGSQKRRDCGGWQPSPGCLGCKGTDALGLGHLVGRSSALWQARPWPHNTVVSTPGDVGMNDQGVCLHPAQTASEDVREPGPATVGEARTPRPYSSPARVSATPGGVSRSW